MAFDMNRAIKHIEAVAEAARVELGCEAVFVYAVYRDGENAVQTSSARQAEGLDLPLGDLIRAHLKELGR